MPNIFWNIEQGNISPKMSLLNITLKQEPYFVPHSGNTCNKG